jgi:putative ABC transport system permease protein
VPAATSVRGSLEPPRRPRWGALAAAGAAAALIAALAIGTSAEPLFAAGFIACALALLLLLTALGAAIRWTASKLPRPRILSSGSRSAISTAPARRPAGWWSRSASA